MPRNVALARPALATLVHPCTSTRKRRSDSFHGKLMAAVLPQRLVEVETKSKTYIADTLEIVPYYGTI